jgi:hypothetical protein
MVTLTVVLTGWISQNAELVSVPKREREREREREKEKEREREMMDAEFFCHCPE